MVMRKMMLLDITTSIRARPEFPFVIAAGMGNQLIIRLASKASNSTMSLYARQNDEHYWRRTLDAEEDTPRFVRMNTVSSLESCTLR